MIGKAVAVGDRATVDRLAPVRPAGQPRVLLVAPTAVPGLLTGGAPLTAIYPVILGFAGTEPR